MATLARRFRLSFGQLRWKLTASYTAVTVGALIVVALAVLAAGALYWRVNASITPGLLLRDLEAGYAPLLRPYLADQPPDRAGLRAFLAGFDANLVGAAPVRLGNLQLSLNAGEVAAVVFFGAEGKVIDSLPHEFLADELGAGGVVASGIAGSTRPLRAALAGIRDEDQLIEQLENRAWVGAFPVFASDRSVRIVGAVAFVTQPVLWSPGDLAKQVGLLILFVVFLAGVMGTLFGSLTARGLLRRVRMINAATVGWSRGEFSGVVDDPAGDELASLADDLNRMAQQLAQLLEQRQKVSIMEERNRLARDLHDSAKQQAFAASAQLGAARALLSVDRDAAGGHVQEAEALVDQVRHELAVLIHELRPAWSQEVRLDLALSEYARDWAELNGCALEFSVVGDRWLPADVQEALFRITQEALSNVARHSCATRIVVALRLDQGDVRLKIQDDGCGFDVGQANHGFGLNSMRERAALIGACLSVFSTSEAGTTVEVIVPA